MKDLNCPYCDAGLDVCHDDGFGYEEDRAHEMECDECGKNFVFHTLILFYYSPKKADCLNGSPHNFREWRAMWLNEEGGEHQRRGCKDCDHCEEMTVKPEGAKA
jgi:hypothetical protein